MSLLPQPRTVVHLDGVLVQVAGQVELLCHLVLPQTGVVLAQLEVILVEVSAGVGILDSEARGSPTGICAYWTQSIFDRYF